jgi:sugar/nucleoside kinase (ribokinase family)
MSSLIHLGNAVVDLVLTVPHLPERGGDVLADGATEWVGGGFNVMAAAARQGMAVTYAGVHGTGRRGDLVRAALSAEGVRLLQPVHRGLDTGLVVVMVGADGERTFVTVPGAEAQLDAAALARVVPGPDDVLYVTGYSLAHPANRAALIDWLPGAGDARFVLFDPGPLVRTLPTDAVGVVLERADWVSANAAEAATLTGTGDPAEAARALLARTGGDGVVVRCGAAGCVLALPGADPVVVPAVPAEVVDLNGAGDAHTGAFLACLAGGADPLTAARWANAAAGLAIGRRGPATGPTSGEVAGLLARQVGD